MGQARSRCFTVFLSILILSNQYLISAINEQEHDDKVSGGQEHEQSDSDMVFEHPIVQEGVGGIEHIADVFG